MMHLPHTFTTHFPLHGSIQIAAYLLVHALLHPLGKMSIRVVDPYMPVYPNLEVDRARNNEFPLRPNPPTALAPQAMDSLSVKHEKARHALLTDAYEAAKADTLALASLLQERDREVAELRRRAAMAPHLSQMEEDFAEIKHDLQWLASHLAYPYESLHITPEAPDVSGMMIEPTASAGPSRAGPSPSPGM